MMAQLMGEQMFNRASLREFKGEFGGHFIARALDEFEKSTVHLSSAMDKNQGLLIMLRENELRPEFEKALVVYLDELQVNELPRIGEDDRSVETLEDIIIVLQSEFNKLLELTKGTLEATRNLQDAVDKGQFVDAVLQDNTPFNQQKIALGFGRAEVASFMSYACHATIKAIEENYPTGFEFLIEPKSKPTFGLIEDFKLENVDDVMVLLEQAAFDAMSLESSANRADLLVRIADTTLNAIGVSEQ